MRQPGSRWRVAASVLVVVLPVVGAGGCPEDNSNGGGMTCAHERQPIASTIGQPSASGRQAKATFAAGCFWGVEASFRSVEGVLATTVGYTGGTFDNPTYRDVCSGKTGHAEAVEIIYDPDQVSFAELLKVFWRCHDPTTRNRQGPDVGSQYRSAIFFHSQSQAAAAQASKEEQVRSGGFKRPIVTEIVPASAFYPAEAYHQQYLEKRGQVSSASH